MSPPTPVEVWLALTVIAPPYTVMSPVDDVAAANVMSLVLLADPTVKLPTDTVEEDVGKLSAPSKLVEFGAKLTAPAVLSDMCVESTRSAVVILKSPPT